MQSATGTGLEASSRIPAPEGAADLGRVGQLWVGLCAAALVIFLAGRMLYFSPLPLSDGLLSALQQLLMLATFSLMVTLFTPIVYGLAALLLLVLLLRRRWVFVRDGGLHRLRPWVVIVLWTVLLFCEGVFDWNPRIGLACAFALPALHPGFRRGLASLPPPRRRLMLAAFWLALVSGALLLALDEADRLVLLLWLVIAWALIHPLAHRFGGRERLLAALVVIPFIQVLGGRVPLSFRLHEGIHLGEPMAYSFCESPERNRLYASVPVCQGQWIDIELCKDSFVAEYDTRDISLVARHHLLSDRFHGRIEQLLCLEDTVQVGMAFTLFEGERQIEDVMEFTMDDPSDVRVHLLGEEGGHRVHYDPGRDQLYYLGESLQKFHRVDRRTGRMDRFHRAGPAATQMTHGDLHVGRGSLFYVGIATALKEVDLDTLEIASSRGAGGSIEMAVDEELDRVYVTGFWGIEVHDLATGRILFRRRTGMMSRRPLIDRERGLVYVATMGGGKLHVFDRESFRLLGAVPIGMGSRYPYLLEDGSRLFVGNENEYFHFDAGALARRFGRF